MKRNKNKRKKQRSNHVRQYQCTESAREPIVPQDQDEKSSKSRREEKKLPETLLVMKLSKTVGEQNTGKSPPFTNWIRIKWKPLNSQPNFISRTAKIEHWILCLPDRTKEHLGKHNLVKPLRPSITTSKTCSHQSLQAQLTTSDQTGWYGIVNTLWRIGLPTDYRAQLITPIWVKIII